MQRVRRTAERRRGFYGRPFDIVHGHDWLASCALERVKHELQRPSVLTIHRPNTAAAATNSATALSREIREIELKGIDLADRVICVSRALAEEVNALYGAPSEKLAVLYNGVNVGRFDTEVDNAGRIARNGRSEAETRFSWNVVAEGTLKLYESIH